MTQISQDHNQTTDQQRRHHLICELQVGSHMDARCGPESHTAAGAMRVRTRTPITSGISPSRSENSRRDVASGASVAVPPRPGNRGSWNHCSETSSSRTKRSGAQTFFAAGQLRHVRILVRPLTSSLAPVRTPAPAEAYFFAQMSGFSCQKDPASKQKSVRFVRILTPGSPPTFPGPPTIPVRA